MKSNNAGKISMTYQSVLMVISQYGLDRICLLTLERQVDV